MAAVRVNDRLCRIGFVAPASAVSGVVVWRSELSRTSSAVGWLAADDTVSPPLDRHHLPLTATALGD